MLKVRLKCVKILILQKYEVLSVYNLATSSGKDQYPAPVFTLILYCYNSLYAHPVTFVIVEVNEEMQPGFSDHLKPAG